MLCVTNDPGQPSLPIDALVARRIRQRRTACGLSRRALADALGFSLRQLEKYEQGAKRVGASRLYRIARALDVKVVWFFTEDTKSSKSESSAGKTLPSLSRGAWRAERLPLDRLEDPRAIAMMQAVMAGADPIDASGNLGIWDDITVLIVSGEGVVSAHVGRRLTTVSPSVVGRPVQSRRDADYAHMLELHMAETADEPQGTLYRISKDANVSYLRYAVAHGRFVLTIPHNVVAPPGFVIV
ncbi:MAG: helix-turn-helix transcriptional regulator [Rhodospirillales bacterium]|nr:helix-turn-helix transcriptional regulator [Rhodospirillales bacterium]